MPRRLLSTLIIIAFTPFFILAQDSWDLERCIRYAQENSLQIKQSRYSVDFAEINKKQAIQSRYPNLSGNTNLNFNFGRTVDPTSNDFITNTFVSNNYSLNTGIMLFNGNNINNTIKQSKIDLSAAHEDVKQSQSDIALNVASSFLNVLLAQEEVENANFQKQLSEEQLDQVDKFINAGSRPQNDRLDFVAQLATAEQTIIAAENRVSMSLLNLKAWLRLDPDYDLQLETPSLDIPIESDPELVNFTAMYTEALRLRPEIRASEFRLQSAMLDQKINESLLLPRVTLGGSIGTNYSNQGMRTTGDFTPDPQKYEVKVDGVTVLIEQEFMRPVLEDDPYFNQLDGNLSYGFGFNVSIPLYSNYSNRAAVERSKVNILNTKTTNEQLKDNLKTTIQQVISEARAAKKAYEVSNKSLAARQAAFDNTEKKFNIGATSSFEYINAQNQLETSKINQLLSKYDYIFKLKVLDYYQGKTIKLD